jgi:hypothetical protein
MSRDKLEPLPDGVLAIDASEFDAHLRRFLQGLEPHGVDGVLVVFFRGRNSGVSASRRGPVTLPELRALALAAVAADHKARTQ